jgi:hypothetical protein
MFFEHAPLYAYFVAGCYQLGGIRMLSLQVVQAVLSGFMAFFVGCAAAGLAQNHARLAGFIGSGFVLINLQFASYTGVASPTTLLLFFVSLALCALVCGSGKFRLPVFVLALAAGVYAQAAFFIVAVGVIGFLLFSCWRERRLSWLLAAVVLAAFTFSKPAISLFIDRAKETHSTEPPTAVLWEANNPYYQSMTAFSLWERRPGNHWSKWQQTPEEDAQYESYLARAGGNGTRAALAWIRENPKDYLELCVVRAGAVFGPITAQMSPLLKKIWLGMWLLVFPAGFYGLWRLRKHSFAHLAGFAMLVEFSFEILVMAGWQPRYRLPIDLMLYLAAAGVYAAGIGGWFAAKDLSPARSAPETAR